MTAALTVDRVERHFGGLRAVDGVSFDIAAGEIVAIIGPNGAGKTTLFNLVTGRIPVSAGRIAVNGRDITRLGVRGRVRAGVAATFQIPRVLAGLTVGEILEAALHYGRDVGDARLEIEALCDQFDLDPGAQTSRLDLHSLKKLEMCRAVAVRPSVLLLDEVAAGLDEDERSQVSERVRELAAANACVVVVEHSMDFVRSLCQRAIALSFGRVIASGPVAEVLSDEAVASAYLGRTDATA